MKKIPCLGTFCTQSVNKGLIEKLHGTGQEIGHQLTYSSGSRSMDENDSCNNDPHMIHILNERLCHFVPVLHKASVPNKPIQKQINLSLSEGVQSQDNPTAGLALYPVKCVAASPQQLSLLFAQLELLCNTGKRRVKVLLMQTYIKP